MNDDVRALVSIAESLDRVATVVEELWEITKPALIEEMNGK